MSKMKGLRITEILFTQAWWHIPYSLSPWGAQTDLCEFEVGLVYNKLQENQDYYKEALSQTNNKNKNKNQKLRKFCSFERKHGTMFSSRIT